MRFAYSLCELNPKCQVKIMAATHGVCWTMIFLQKINRKAVIGNGAAQDMCGLLGHKLHSFFAE